MSYAHAAGSDTNGKDGKYYNEDMIVRFANGLQYDTLAEVLHQRNYLKYVTGFQRIAYNRRYALVFNNSETRDHLVLHSLDINGIHINSEYHKRRNPPPPSPQELEFL